jgi:sulfoxide reductase heme-binding subunit YedZ
MPRKLPAVIALAAIVGLVIVAGSGLATPAQSAYEAQIRLWLIARASGLVAFGLLTLDVLAGLMLASPPSEARRRLGKPTAPFHQIIWVFTASFLAAHIAALVFDPYAGVGIGGAFWPGLSAYRSVPVAIGVLAMYAMLFTALTARYGSKLPPGLWLKLHRGAALVWAAALLHGVTAGTDSPELVAFYGAAFGLVGGAFLVRHWSPRKTVRRVSAAVHHRPGAQPSGSAAPVAVASASSEAH